MRKEFGKGFGFSASSSGGSSAITLPELPGYAEPTLYQPQYCGWNGLGMTHVSLRPQSYHYQGTHNRIYFVLYNWCYNALGVRRAAPYEDNATYVGYYDLTTKTFSALTKIAHLFTSSTDGHDNPSVFVSDDGHILVAKEQLKGGGEHNSPIEIWRSDNVEDISAFTKIAEFTKAGYAGFSYPTWHKTSVTGKIFMTLRGQPSGHTMHLVIVSTDNGATWAGLDGTANTPSPIASCASIAGSGLDWYFYTNKLNGSRTSGICLAANLNEGPGGTSPDGTLAASRNKFVMYLYSADGITWGNANYQAGTAGAFSKNVLVSGEITPAELLANFLVVDCSTIAYKSFSMREVAISPENVPYIMFSTVNRYDSALNPDYSTKDNLVDSTSLVYFDSTTEAWVTIDLSNIENESDDVDATVQSFIGYRPVMNVYQNDVIDIVLSKVIAKTDPYKSQKLITASGEAIGGGMFKIITTVADNFGEGLIAGDHWFYTSSTYTSRIDADNTLTPLETHLVFLRSRDKGVTWTHVRAPLKITEYLGANIIGAGSGNAVDSGKLALWFGIPKRLSGGTVYDYADLMLLVDEFEPL